MSCTFPSAKSCTQFSSPPSQLYIQTNSSCSISSHLTKNAIQKHFILQLSLPCYVLFIRSRYFPQHPALYCLQSMFPPRCQRLSLIPIQNNTQGCVSYNLIFNPLNPELNPICYLLALLGAHHFLHVSRIRVKLSTFRLLMSYIYGAPILDVSRSHTTTQHSR